MNRRAPGLHIGILALMAFLTRPMAGVAADIPDATAHADADVICFAEQPAIVEGESVTLQAWVSMQDGRPPDFPFSLAWNAAAGRIDTAHNPSRWDLSSLKVPADAAVRRLTATVEATAPGQIKRECTVEIFIGRKVAAVPDRGPLQADSLFSAKRFLLPGDVEAPSFGLYSYLLLGAPPKDAEQTSRYLKTIEAYLLVLQNVDDYLTRHVRPGQLNATYIPLKSMPKAGASNADWATNVLAVYDYATAQILLSRTQMPHKSGPYLISTLAPLSETGSAYLWQDLSGVAPELTWTWVEYFTYLAAQQRSWTQSNLPLFGLKLRNLIAVGGKVTPATIEVLQKAIGFKSKM